MESIYSMGTQAWREWVTYWTDKVKTKADLVNGVIPIAQIPVVAPAWLTYKALLTQATTDAPVLRVLNQDEADYIDINFTLDTDIVSTETFDTSLSVTNLGTFPITGQLTIPVIEGGYDDVYLEVKVKQRGVAPVLLAAETNTAGDKVFLTFNKAMNPYQTTYAITNTFIIGLTDSAADEIYEVNGAILTLNTNETMLEGEDYTVFLDAEFLEAFDYGGIENIDNFPIVNNVIAPE